MTVRDTLKHAAFLALGSGLRASIRASRLRRSRVVLNLHRVSEPDGSAYVPLRPHLFEELLAFLSRRFPLRTVADHEPGVVLSFDDGYKDFIEVAAPILCKHGVRCNHNIIPECVETGLPPLNVLAQDFVGKAPAALVMRLAVPGFRMEGANLGHRLSAFIKNKPMAEQKGLAECLVPQFFAWSDFEPTRMMTRADVLQMAREHEVGAHSFSHASMGCETLEYLRDDVARCRSYFEGLALPMDIYAFPNGSCTEEQVRIVEDAGVRHVLLVGEDFDTHPRRHSRFTFHARSRAEMRFRALGGLRRITA